MRCDLCERELTRVNTIVRFTSAIPDMRIKSLVLIHRACDTHQWPAKGHGHIDIRALTSKHMAELQERLTNDVDRDKLAAAWQRWGCKLVPDDGMLTDEQSETMWELLGERMKREAQERTELEELQRENEQLDRELIATGIDPATIEHV